MEELLKLLDIKGTSVTITAITPQGKQKSVGLSNTDAKLLLKKKREVKKKG